MVETAAATSRIWKRGSRLGLHVLLGAIVLCAWPVSAPGADKTIGVILSADIPFFQSIHQAFVEKMASQGLGPDKVEIFVQTPGPEAMAWTNAARKFVAYGVDVIVCYGTPAAVSVIKETSDVPVVFAGVYDPKAAGINKPNATGVSSKVPVATVIKNLKKVKDFSRMGVVFNPDEKDTAAEADEVRELEGKLGFQSVRFQVRGKQDVPQTADVDAVLFTSSSVALFYFGDFVGMLRNAKVPSGATLGGAEEKGMILTVTADPKEQGSTVAEMVARVVQGAKPSILPVIAPTKINMVINLKEANVTGLKLPFDLLSTATQVIK